MSAPATRPDKLRAQAIAFLKGAPGHDDLYALLLSASSSPQTHSPRPLPAPTRAQSLASLAATHDPAEHLLLASLLHQLLASLTQVDPATRPDPTRVAALFTQGVFPLLQQDVERVAALADAWIDVVWQLDQELPTRIDLAIPPLQPRPPQDAQDAQDGMQVDGQDEKAAAPQSSADRSKLVAAEVLNARARLAQLCKALAVRRTPLLCCRAEL